MQCHVLPGWWHLHVRGHGHQAGRHGGQRRWAAQQASIARVHGLAAPACVVGHASSSRAQSPRAVRLDILKARQTQSEIKYTSLCLGGRLCSRLCKHRFAPTAPHTNSNGNSKQWLIELTVEQRLCLCNTRTHQFNHIDFWLPVDQRPVHTQRCTPGSTHPPCFASCHKRSKQPWGNTSAKWRCSIISCRAWRWVHAHVRLRGSTMLHAAAALAPAPLMGAAAFAALTPCSRIAAHP